MKIRLMFASMLLIALAFACGGTGSGSPEEQLETAMMAEHDKVMPKMGEANELYKEMRQYLFLDTTMTMEKRERLSMVTANLGEASEGMMNWMNGISDLEMKKNSMKPEELTQYLTEQKQSIVKIGELMEKSIAEAKTALAERKK